MMSVTCATIGQTLPMPALCLMLPDGAARFGRRTPEPHVWPAAPSSLARGDGWRGAAVDIENKIRGWRDGLREEAETSGLSPHDALLYYGDYGLLFEIIACELDDCEHCTDPVLAYSFRDWLIVGVKEKLISGKLVAFADNPTDRRIRLRIPSDAWRNIIWSDDAPISEPVPSLRLGFEISGYSNVIIKEPSQPKRASAPNAAPPTVCTTQNSPEPDADTSETPPQQPKKQSRFKGGGYSRKDAPLIQEMKSLLEQGKASSVWDAAHQVVERAEGGGSPDSKTKRLTRRFNKTFPDFSEAE